MATRIDPREKRRVHLLAWTIAESAQAWDFPKALESPRHWQASFETLSFKVQAPLCSTLASRWCWSYRTRIDLFRPHYYAQLESFDAIAKRDAWYERNLRFWWVRRELFLLIPKTSKSWENRLAWFLTAFVTTVRANAVVQTSAEPRLKANCFSLQRLQGWGPATVKTEESGDGNLQKTDSSISAWLRVHFRTQDQSQEKTAIIEAANSFVDSRPLRW